jgi:hypothetical protein
MLNDNGDAIELHIHESLYVPSLPMNLLSPQQICQQTKNPDDGFIISATTGTLCFANHQRTLYYNPKNNLPIFFTSSAPSTGSSSSISSSSKDTSTQALLSSADTTCFPLTSTQHHLLLKHQQLGHLHMARVQQLACDGFFGPSYKATGTCDPPLCSSCLQGKQHKRATTPGTTTGSIDINHLDPGMCVSGDQLESSTPGLVPTFQGSPTTSSYRASTLFVDHASRFLYFTPHLSTGAQEAVATKHRFELHAMSFHHTIHCYHTDNGIFEANSFGTKGPFVAKVSILVASTPITKME